MNRLKQRIAAGEQVAAAWLELGNPDVAEIMVRHGWTTLVIDGEHGVGDLDDWVAVARAVEAGFEVLLTADRQMYRQHDFSKLPLAVVVTPGNRLSILNGLRETIVTAVEQTAMGDYVEIPGPPAAGGTLDGSETAL